MNWIDFLQYVAPLGIMVVWFLRIETHLVSNKKEIESNKRIISDILDSNNNLNDKIFMLALEQTKNANDPLSKKEFHRKNELLDKLAQKTIDVTESKELKAYLEREEVEQEREARKTGKNWLAVVGITAALFLLKSIINEANQEKV